MKKKKESDLGSDITEILLGLCCAALGGLALGEKLYDESIHKDNSDKIVNDTSKINNIDYLNNHKSYYFYIEH